MGETENRAVIDRPYDRVWISDEHDFDVTLRGAVRGSRTVRQVGREDVTGPRAQRTPLERIALRFPGVIRRVFPIVVRVRASNPTLDQFRAAWLAGNEAFNRRDFATAFATLASDCEFHSLAYATERLLVGPEQVCRFFGQEIFGTFPDWRTDPVHFLQAGDGLFVVLMRGQGTGGTSSVPTRVDLAAVWELRKGVPVRVREFPTWEEALSAAGLDPSAAADMRAAERSGA